MIRSFKQWILVILALLWGGSPAAADLPRAALIELSGPIGPATAGYFHNAQGEAVVAGDDVIVLRLDTPGGLESAMRDIIKDILASPIPVVAWVGPNGARAASAGTYILYAAQLAAMAPATNLGAATPIPLGGSWPVPGSEPADKHGSDEKSAAASSAPSGDAEERKAVNDAVAYIHALAELRGRNADWAESAVRGAASLSAQQALRLNVIDVLADDLPDLLRKADGRQVRTASGTVALRTMGATITALSPGWRMQVLSALTNPTLAYVLLLIGIYGLMLEGFHPGAILPGVIGGIALLLALYAFQMLPVHFAGLALIVLGVALLVAEVHAPTFGVLGFGGVIAFVLGSVLLLDTDVPGFGVNIGVIVGIALGAVGVLGLTLYLILRARRAPVVTGRDAVVGEIAELLEALGGGPHDEGWARVHGERWRVRSSVPMPQGSHARVTRMNGLLLTVEPLNESESTNGRE